ncbi:MAG: 6-carboxytetrahydropterin synthase, partial [Flammeovirgaceae bacterium]|nr:6-carboxytetrahydropterin synthase [Flammeovirgaceae bacterium]
MKATLVYRTHFNAAYRTYNPNWSKEKNIHIFGTNAEKIAFKGHNYDIEIHLHGEVNPTTGTIMPIQELSQLIKENIEMRYDHRNLYDDVEDFRDTVPTPEMLAY